VYRTERKIETSFSWVR